MFWGIVLFSLFVAAIALNIACCFASEYVSKLLNVEVDNKFVDKYKDL
jgi:hypothetical protein